MINGFLVNREHIIFFDRLLNILCMGWEVKIDMSGQSNDCLRVHMKCKNEKKYWGRNGAHFQECMGYGDVASSDLNFLRWDCR